MLNKDFVRLLLYPDDRNLLEKLVALDGDTSMSAMVRKLIRNEADRRGIVRQQPVGKFTDELEHA